MFGGYNNMSSKYDIGLLGLWNQCNYGSIVTYYALNRTLENMGMSVLMIDRPNADTEESHTHARKFAMENYKGVTIPMNNADLHRLNQSCGMFMTGSDQLWNYSVGKNYGKIFYLDFAADNKRKISYATSFGHEIDFAPETQRTLLQGYFRRFNKISVREDNGVDILKNIYGIAAEQVIDPVFLCDKKLYENLAAKSKLVMPKEKYILSCLIDPTEEKKTSINTLSNIFDGMKTINLLDGFYWLSDKNCQKIGIEREKGVETADWLSYILNAEIIITDSYHTLCLAMIFGKNFVALPNKFRGYSRFDSIGRLFDIREKYAYEAEDMLKNPDILLVPDYGRIAAKITSEKKRCTEWLKNAVR